MFHAIRSSFSKEDGLFPSRHASAPTRILKETKRRSGEELLKRDEMEHGAGRATVGNAIMKKMEIPRPIVRDATDIPAAQWGIICRYATRPLDNGMI